VSGCLTMTTDQNNLKTMADRLTDLLSSAKSGREVESILNREMSFGDKERANGNKTPVKSAGKVGSPPRQQKKVGIWEPVVKNGQTTYVRPQNGDPRKLWADVECIKPKDGKFRVALLGESVARGYFLDPDFNCAVALQTILEAATDKDTVEVIDLAQVSQGFIQLKNLINSAPAIEPDALVIFAGNNWYSAHILDAIDFETAGEILRRENNWAAVRGYAEGVVRRQVSLFAEYLGKLSKEWSVPIVFIIPDYNLVDWEVSQSWQNPLITSDLEEDRARIKANAEDAMAAGDYKLAAALGNELIRIDEEASPTGYEILAQCDLIRGNFVGARHYREKAIDTGFTAPIMAPRCFSIMQEALRSSGASCGLLIVDMPQIFQECLSSELPGRRYFLDFCHMTAEGIWIAMASAAEKILPLLGVSSFTRSELRSYEYPVDCKVIARAHLKAALINAYLGQGYEIIHHHCSEALRRDPEVYSLLRLIIECHLRRAHDMNLISRMNEYSREPAVTLNRMNPTIAYNAANHLSPQLIHAVTNVLSESHPDIADEINELLVKEYCVTERGTDLLSRSYIDVVGTHLEFLWEDRYAFFKSYQAETRFRLICEKAEAIDVRITGRVPIEDVLAKEVRLSVNGKIIQVFNADSKWRTWNFMIPADLLRRGINSLVICWPKPVVERKRRVEEVANALEAIPLGGQINDMYKIYKVYGEVYECKAFLNKGGM
jgi:hypothetical protein